MKIGILDSGVGGLTSFLLLLKKYPMTDFIYLADQKNYPYGTKTREKLLVILCKNLASFEDCDCIVLACNTASVLADELRKITTIPIYDCLSETAKRIKGQDVLVLGTTLTIKSMVFQKYFACGGSARDDLVLLIEDELSKPIPDLKSVAKKIILDQSVTTVVLGCTHFNWLMESLEDLYPAVSFVPTVVENIPDYIAGNHHVAMMTTGNVDDFVQKLSKIGIIYNEAGHYETNDC